MVGDHGQIIPFRRIKGIAIALITVATLAILAAVGLGLWGGWLRVQNAALVSELDASREAVRSLKDEKDLLMARVVILETQAGKPVPAKTSVGPAESGAKDAAKTAAAKMAGAKTTSGERAPSTSTAAPPAKTKAAVTPIKPVPSPAKKAAEATSPKKPATSAPLVAVSGFIADHSARRDTLSASFKIQNTGARGRKVSGRCVLVMKNEVQSDTKWVAVPHVSLISGRPNGKQGRAFRIANFMTLKMQTRELPANFAFDTGTLYVFDQGGKQILEKEVSVQLSYRKPAPKPEPKPDPKPAPAPTPPPAPASSATTTTTTPAQPQAEPVSPSPPTPTPLAVPDAPARKAPVPQATDLPPTENASPAIPASVAPAVGQPSAPPAPATPDSLQPPPVTTVAPGSGPEPGDDPSLLPEKQGAPQTAPPEQGTEDSR